MKLADMTNEQAADAMLIIASEFQEICDDLELIRLIRSGVEKLPKDVTDEQKEEHAIKSFQTGVSKVTSLVPALLKDHRKNVFTILSAVNCCSYEEIGKMKLGDTMASIKELFADTILTDFFKSSVRSALSA